MKKSAFSLLVMAASLAFTSCSSDDVFTPTGEGDVTVSFTAQLPGAPQGRAFGDGTTATQLTYALYEVGENGDLTLIGEPDKSKTFADLKTTVTLKLVNGKGYKVLFWADAAAGSPYSFDAASQTITADYTGVVSNVEARDAFFAVKEIEKVTGPVSETVTLKRPFAQVNVGTDDLDAPAVGDLDLKSKLTTKAYTKLNLLTGEASDQTDVTFDFAAAPQGETFPVTGYGYLSMNYLLVPADKELIDMTFTINDGAKEMKSLDIKNVPVQRNYRTNIYGSLLTSEFNYNVVIEPTPDDNLNQPINVEEPEVDAQGVTHITKPEELAYLAKNPTIWKGKTIQLDNDIDLMGMSWTPIGSNSKGSDKNDMNYFEGTFDGKNHKISNFRCNATGNYAVAGLFGALRGVIKNLTVENAYITSNHYAGGIVAYSHNNNSGTYGDGKDYPAEGYAIENCKVFNSTIISTPNKQANGSYDNGDKVGGIIGYACSKMTLKNCETGGVTLQAYRDLGGIIGYAAATKDLAVTLDYVVSRGNTLIQSYDYAYKANSAVYKHHGEIYGATDGVAPTIPESIKNVAHSNDYFVMNMTPTNTDELYEALRYAGEGSVVTLVETTYELFEGVDKPTNTLAMKNNGKGVNFTIKGAGVDKSIMKINNYAFPNSNITFQDFTVDIQGNGYSGFSNYLNGKFSNMKFQGILWTWGKESVVYNNCEFTGIGKGDIYPVWVKITADATFNDCTVKSEKGRAFLLCGDADFNAIPVHNVTINNCEVEVEGESKDKAVFEIHTEADADNITGTITLNNVKWDSTKFTSLWRELNNTGTEPATDFYTVIVDGKTEQTGSR